MLTAWRRLPYLDPGLPLEHLPPDWPGIEAAELFSSLDSRLRDDAHTHAHAIVHGGLPGVSARPDCVDGPGAHGAGEQRDAWTAVDVRAP